MRSVKRNVGTDPLWTGPFIILVMSAGFMYMSTFMMLPTLPLFVIDAGLGTIEAGGVIVAAYAIGSLVPRLLWGRLADTWGRQRVFIVGAVTIALVSPFFSLLSALPPVIALRLLQGIGFSASSTAGAAIAADLVPSSRRAEGIGYYTLANTVGMALGPALGLMLQTRLGDDWLFRVSAAFGVIAVVGGLLLRYETSARAIPVRRRPASGHSLHATQGAPQPLAWLRRVFWVCLVFGAVATPYGAVMAYVAVYGKDVGVSDIGMYFTVFSIAVFIVRLVAGRLTGRIGQAPVLVSSLLAMLSGMITLFWANSLDTFLVSAVLVGIGFGVSMPLLQATVITFAPADRRGSASAAFLAIADIGYAIGALLLGLLAAEFGFPVAFPMVGAFAAVAIAVYLWLVVPSARRPGP